jgi:hypothetical protein
MEPQTTSGIRPWQWILTIIIIVILGVLVYFVMRGDDTTTNPPVTGTEPTTQDVAQNRTNSVSVNDQFPGNVVFLTSVSVSKPGFAVVSEVAAGNKMGAVLGTLYFPQAGIFPGKVLLSKPTVDGKSYMITLYEDDGDKIFNAAKDMQLKDTLGNAVMKIFKATSQITEVKG